MIVGTKVVSRSITPKAKPEAKFALETLEKLLMAGEEVTEPPKRYAAGVADFAEEIIYHRMQVSVSPELTFSYDFLPGSGVYRPAQIIKDADLDSLIVGLQGGTLPVSSSLYNMHGAAPNIVAKKKCFIAIELVGPQNLMFRPGAPAIKIDQTKASYYTGLFHYDTSLIRYPDNAPTADQEPCYIVCFGLSNFRVDDKDDFSIFFQFTQPSNSTIYAEVDPHIKNRG